MARSTPLRILVVWLSLGVLAGFLVGAVESVREIAANDYLRHGLHRLALSRSIRACGEGTAWGLALSLLAGLIALGGRAFVPWLRTRAIAVEVVDRDRALGYLLAAIGTVLFFFASLHRWFVGALPPISRFQEFLVSLRGAIYASLRIEALPALILLLAASVGVVLLLGFLLRLLRPATVLAALGRAAGSRVGLILAAAVLVAVTAGEAYFRFLDPRFVQERRNLVLLTIDTLRSDHLGCYGYERDTSPFLDSLASRSLFFRDAYTPWPTTTPAVASLLTGLYPHSAGVTRIAPYQYLEDRFVVLAELLRNEGYYTEAVVSNLNIASAANFDQGFERFAYIGGSAENTNSLALPALERLAGSRNRGAPFFFWVHFIDPHTPYRPPAHRELFIGDSLYHAGSTTVPVTDEPMPRIPIGEGEGPLSPYERHRRVEVNQVGMGTITPGFADRWSDDPAYHIALYDSEIRYLDDHVRELVTRLRERGLLERSLMVVTSDHGESLGDHDYYFRHGRFGYEATLRVPLFLLDPGREAREVQVPASLLDLTPTLLDLLSIPKRHAFEGTSLLPSIERPEESAGRDLFAEAGYAIDYQKIVVRKPWKLLHIPDPIDRSLMRGREFELYDIVEDPGEEREIGDANAEVLQELRRELLRWEERNRFDRGETPQRVPAYSEEEIEHLRSLGYIR